MDNQATGNSCPYVWPYLGGGEVTLQPQGGEKVLPSARSIPGRSHIPGFFPTDADQLLSFPHCCVLIVAASGGRLSERSLFWVQRGCIWHGKFIPAMVRLAQLCPQKGFCCVTASLTKKAKTCLLLPPMYWQKLWELLFQLG